MKLLHVTPAYSPFLEKGGPAVKVVAIAEGLARRGHRVTVLTSWHGKPRIARSVDLHGVEVIYLRPITGYRNTTLHAGLLSFCRQRVHDFDLVHIYGLYDLIGPTVGHYCVRAGVPYVLEPLGMFRPIDRSFRLKRIWHGIFGAPLFRHASQVIATSQQEEQELLEDGLPRDRVVLRYNGVDLDDFATLPARGTFRAKWGISPDEPVVLFLGRLIPRKGVDLLITSFARACPQSGRLVVAGPEGEPNLAQSLRAHARAEGIEPRVIFTGTLYGDEKKSALVDCDVFVLASSYENFANSVAEAIACERPVIVTDRCGISEFVAGEVGLVIPREVNALTDALRLLLNNRPLYERFQQACPRVAARLGWREMLDRQESLYGRIRTALKKL
jgi:glycosyltransferase involved in cell wall biosynthesis